MALLPAVNVCCDEHRDCIGRFAAALMAYVERVVCPRNAPQVILLRPVLS
jgi:hypothetical protein